MSERLEEFILDAFISVLVSLNEHSKLILKSVKDEDIRFWLSDKVRRSEESTLGVISRGGNLTKDSYPGMGAGLYLPPFLFAS